MVTGLGAGVVHVSESVGNVTLERYEELVVGARDLIDQVARAQFSLGDIALEIEPMRLLGGVVQGDDVFNVKASMERFAEDIGVARKTVEDWRWTSSRWPAAKRRAGVPFGVHRVLAAIGDEEERWEAILHPPLHERSGTHRWTHDGARRRVGQRVETPVTVEEKVQAVTDLTRDDKVAAKVTVDLLSRPAAAEHVPPADRVRVVAELTRDDEVAKTVTTDLLRRPQVARETMRDDTARFLVNRAQFDNSARDREAVRERIPAVRRIEHTIEYLDLVGSCHQYVATLGRVVPRLRGQEFSDDERETVRRSIAKVRAAADWLEAAVDAGVFTLDEQLAKLLSGE